MQNSKYDPASTSQYTKIDLTLAYKSYEFTATKNTTTSGDFKIENDDVLIDGGRIIANNVVFGDKITCQVIDKDNVLGYGANLVLNEFITNWFLTPTSPSVWDFTSEYPAKLKAGLYIRVKYTSVGTETDPLVKMNLKLHKILW